jgi:hypothetical protein
MLGTLMIDTIHVDVDNIPASTPKVAGYVTGSAEVKWTRQDWDRFPHAGKVRIDQSPQLSAYATGDADIADIESGAGTPGAYATACKQRLASNRLLWCYCDQDTVSRVSGALVAVRIPLSKCGLWLANWNLSQAEADALIGTALSGIRIVAVQWASPSSNPGTQVPGGAPGKTLKEANLDLSVTQPGWFEAVASVGAAAGARIAY